jgi:hypothetical protein
MKQMDAIFVEKNTILKKVDIIEKLVGFGRACAPVRCAHPSFWTH